MWTGAAGTTAPREVPRPFWEGAGRLLRRRAELCKPLTLSILTRFRSKKLELVMAVRTQVLSDGSARPTEPKQIRGG